MLTLTLLVVPPYRSHLTLQIKYFMFDSSSYCILTDEAIDRHLKETMEQMKVEIEYQINDVRQNIPKF